MAESKERKHPNCPKCGANDWTWIPREGRLCVSIDGQHTYVGCRQCGTPYPHEGEPREEGQ